MIYSVFAGLCQSPGYLVQHHLQGGNTSVCFVPCGIASPRRVLGMEELLSNDYFLSLECLCSTVWLLLPLWNVNLTCGVCHVAWGRRAQGHSMPASAPGRDGRGLAAKGPERGSRQNCHLPTEERDKQGRILRVFTSS